jgi:hypothetical protein
MFPKHRCTLAATSRQTGSGINHELGSTAASTFSSILLMQRLVDLQRGVKRSIVRTERAHCVVLDGGVW